MKKAENPKRAIRILGMMSGTSCDGLDAACIEIGPTGWKPLWSKSAPYPAQLRERVLNFQKPNSRHSSRDWLELHRDLGNWYGKTVRQFLKSKTSYLPDVIANHGQTVAHFPAPHCQGTTLQLGDNTRISTLTGLSVVSNFREGDMSAGGQGAPLVPLFHQWLSHKLSPHRPGIAIHNIGGISNLTYIGPNNQILAFDTGPGNVWIDTAVSKLTQGKSRIDWGGRLAASAKPDEKVIKNVLKHPYFSKSPPKSTGRDDFSEDLFFSHIKSKSNTLVSTATQITIDSIVQAYKKWIINKKLPLHSIFICGGGAKNLTLLRGIQSGLPEVNVSDLSQVGFDAQWVEAQAFAVFGYLSLLGESIGGSWTGVKDFGPPGHLIPGKNWKTLMQKISTILKD
jgi:anhydro-N-acetylmuramic acid kinase